MMRKFLNIWVMMPVGAAWAGAGTTSGADGTQEVLIALFGLAAVLAYFGAAWWLKARSPRLHSIMPRYQPPQDLSPADIAYLVGGSADRTQVFTAALLSMAQKGAVRIVEGGEFFKLQRIADGEPALSGGERAAVDELFGRGDALKLKKANRDQVKAARQALARDLEERLGKGYRQPNRPWFFGGALLSLAVMASALLSATDPTHAAFCMGWVIVPTAWLGLTLSSAMYERYLGAKSLARLSSLMPLLFLATGIAVASYYIDPLAAAALVFLGPVNLAGLFLLRTYTPLGREVMEGIEGYRLYLATADSEPASSSKSQEGPVEVFERNLPYAVALEVERQWARQFTAWLADAGRERASYRPAWLTGHSWWNTGDSDLVVDVAYKLAEAVEYASTKIPETPAMRRSIVQREQADADRDPEGEPAM